MNSTLTVRLYDSIDAIQQVRPAWNRLMEESKTASIFSTWEWLVPWWRAYGEGDELLVLGFFDKSNELIGMAPLSLTQRKIAGLPLRLLRLMGDGSEDSDNLDFPVRAGHEDDFAAALLDYLRSELRWDIAELNTLPPDSAAGSALQEELRARRWTRFAYPLARSIVDLPASWDEYLEQVSSKERHHIRYNMRRIEKQHTVRFYKCDRLDELPKLLEILFSLHEMRWKTRGAGGVFSSPARRRFYDQMAREFLTRGWLEFWFLELDGLTVASQFFFRYRDTLYALQMGFNPDYGNLNVQDILRVHIFREAIAEGIKRVDYLAGEDSRKSRFGAKTSTYLNVHFGRSATLGSIYLKARHESSRGKEWLRESVPPLLWRTVKKLKRQAPPINGA